MKITDSIKEKLAKLKEFGLNFSFSEQEQKFVKAMLADGTTEISTDADSFGVGAAVTVNGEPAPDGEHTLATGEMITTVGGVITEAKPAEPAVTEIEIEMSAEDVEALADKATEMGEQVTELTKANESLTTEVASLTEANENFKKEIATLKAEVVKFSKQPAGKSAKEVDAVPANESAHEKFLRESRERRENFSSVKK
jgi:regulator of replication initiation timing